MSEATSTTTVFPAVQTDLPGPGSRALFDRLDPVHIGHPDPP